MSGELLGSDARRRAAAAPFVAIGVLCVIAGGLTAGVTAPAASERSSWASAYLVLVAGVAQVGLGLGGEGPVEAGLALVVEASDDLEVAEHAQPGHVL